MNAKNKPSKGSQNSPQTSSGRGLFLSEKLVSRSAQKLIDAAAFFHYDFRNKTVLDIGSSTGGFTQVALLLGASKVIAIEIGTNQMHPAIASHPGVELHEKTDFLTLSGTNFPPIQTIIADVSFISLTKILKCAIMEGWLRSSPDLLVMLKPQFEVADQYLVNGVLKNSAIRRKTIQNFEFWLKKQGFIIKSKRDNQLSGKNGNIERFYWLKFNVHAPKAPKIHKNNPLRAIFMG